MIVIGKIYYATRAGVYETLGPQHVLAHIDNVEHNVTYGKNACLKWVIFQSNSDK